MVKYDAAIILGGGRFNDGSLTPLSIQRLEAGYDLYKNRRVSKLIALGGYYSTYSSNAIKFDKTGAQLRKEYLIGLAASDKDILKVEGGRDTICEAFATRDELNKTELTHLILVTSDKHMERALWIFKRIFGKRYTIIGEEVPCGSLLNSDEEKEYLKIIKSFFSKFPKEIPMPNLQTWFQDQKELYHQYKLIHDKYHPRGKESQAYEGVKR